VQEHDRLACGIAAFLPVDLVAMIDGEVAVAVRLERRVLLAARVQAPLP
jgi:hypothetical protein